MHQHASKYLIGTHKVGLTAHFAQDQRLSCLKPSQRSPERTLAAIRKIEQRFFTNIEERGAEERRQCQIIIWRRCKPEKGEQILDCQLLSQHQPVRACDRDAALFQAPDQRGHHRLTALQQNDDVTRRNFTSGARQSCAAFQKVGDVVRDDPGKARAGLTRRRHIDRRPWFRVRRIIIRLNQRPKVNAACAGLVERKVGDRGASRA